MDMGQSQFEIGEKVFTYSIHHVERRVPCTFCSGQGRIQGEDGTTAKCPVCTGNGETRVRPDDVKVEVEGPLTIGQVRVTYTHPLYNQERDECYMCKETGVLCGTRYNVKRLFRTKEEAEKAALAEIQEWG